MSTATCKVIIVGSGPAGYTAAIYAARAQLNPLVFEGSQYGGALMSTTEVENFPGFIDGIDGPQLMENLRSQAQRFGAELRSEDVTTVDLISTPKQIFVGDQVYAADSVIIATGSKYRYLGLPDEERLLGRGVSACATCDGFFFRGQDIAVIGGGDSAMEEATFLTRFANTVTIVHRRSEFRSSKIMLERARANDKISWALNKEVIAVEGDQKVSGLVLKDRDTGAESKLAVGGMFVAIGHDPQSGIFAGQLDMDEAGYLTVAQPSTRTKIAGVFAAGDVVDHTYRQAITAAGSGCQAAIDAERWLAEHDE